MRNECFEWHLIPLPSPHPNPGSTERSTAKQCTSMLVPWFTYFPGISTHFCLLQGHGTQLCPFQSKVRSKTSQSGNIRNPLTRVIGQVYCCFMLSESLLPEAFPASEAASLASGGALLASEGAAEPSSAAAVDNIIPLAAPPTFHNEFQ